MKLRNKKTGEIVEVITGDTFEVGGIQIRSLNKNPQIVRYYLSLAELNEEWEDCNGYYYIGDGGDVNLSRTKYRLEHEDEAHEEIGNYFETKEEAEKAVEKLKAWKRLKDKGISLQLDSFRSCIDYRFDLRTLKDDEIVELSKDLDLLFGGEEGDTKGEK